jgi:hypothetical protein
MERLSDNFHPTAADRSASETVATHLSNVSRSERMAPDNADGCTEGVEKAKVESLHRNAQRYQH